MAAQLKTRASRAGGTECDS